MGSLFVLGYMIIDVGRIVLRLSVAKLRCSTDMVVSDAAKMVLTRPIIRVV